MTTEAEFRSTIVREGLKQVGQPYRDSAVPTNWPPEQFDCSVFTHWCCSKAGIDIDHGVLDSSWPQAEPVPWHKYTGYTLSQQAALHRLGADIAFSAIKPGDLLYYDKPGEHHVILYLGGGNAVHAAGTAYGVIVSAVVPPGVVGFGGKTLTRCVSVTKAAKAMGMVFTVPPPPPTVAKVDLSNVIRAAKVDPGASQGHLTYKGDVLPVERALVAEGLLASRWADGSFGTMTISAYSAWQRRCGYHGADADGVPGWESLTALGKKHGFVVVP